MHESNSTTSQPPSSADAAPFCGGASGKYSKPPQPPLYIPPGHVAFRLLCHASRIGGLIGKSGFIIKQLQKLTNSKIRVEDPINSCDHRVISVVSSSAITNKMNLSGFAPKEELNIGGTISGKCEDEEWFEVSAAQEGVIRVFERVVELAADGDSMSVAGIMVSCKLLAWKNQAGAVIGKGGKVVEKIRKDTGCRVRILAPEKFLSASADMHEIVEIEGNFQAVKKALVAVTSRLQECQPPEKSRIYGTVQVENESLPIQNLDLCLQQSQMLQPMPSNSTNNSLGSGVPSLELENVSDVDSGTPQQEVVFNLLCPKEKVGSIIGKGGSIVKALQIESGASINVGPILADCDERLIVIAAMESVDSQYSPAQNAALLVFNRFTEAGLVKGLYSESKESTVSARLAIPSIQVGCLLGKGGAIISEMRRATGTSLRIIGGYQVPKCASENNEVIQITGECGNVRDALYLVTGRLRANILSIKTNARSGGNYNTLNTDNRMRKVPPPISLGNFESSLINSMGHLGINRPPSPPALQNIGRKLPGGAELLSGSGSGIVTNTAIEIVIPDSVIGSIYGDNLARIREISGAQVVVHDETPETSVVISGTHNETQVAESLLRAFMLASV